MKRFKTLKWLPKIKGTAAKFKKSSFSSPHLSMQAKKDPPKIC